MQTDEHFPDRLTVLVPHGLKRELDAAARERTQTMSEFVRRTLLRAVMARSLMKQHPKVEQPAAPASPMASTHVWPRRSKQLEPVA
jgi:hypothetical protein